MGTKKALLIAKEFSDQVKKKYPVDKIYLFGSYAKDGANEGSDIDLCVVSPIFHGSIALRASLTIFDTKIWER